MSRFALTDIFSEVLGQTVRETSVNAMVRCPFHQDNTASLSIHLEEGVWKCHSCARSGGLESLASLVGKTVDQDVLLDMAISSIERPSQARKDFSMIAYEHEKEMNRLPRGNALLARYLQEKNIPCYIEDFKEEFWVGYSHERDALTFPYLDSSTVPMIRYRKADGFKFFETGSRRSIYRIDEIRGAGRVIIFEGESDLHTAWAYRESNSGFEFCAVPGASTSEAKWEEWAIDFLFAEEIFVAYDNDDAGNSGAEVAIKVLGNRAKRLRPSRGNDINEHFSLGGTWDELFKSV